MHPVHRLLGHPGTATRLHQVGQGDSGHLTLVSPPRSDTESTVVHRPHALFPSVRAPASRSRTADIDRRTTEGTSRSPSKIVQPLVSSDQSKRLLTSHATGNIHICNIKPYSCCCLLHSALSALLLFWELSHPNCQQPLNSVGAYFSCSYLCFSRVPSGGNGPGQRWLVSSTARSG